MSNALSWVPINLTNIPLNINGATVGVSSLEVKVTWERPSDFSDWSSDFYIVLTLQNATYDVNVTPTVATVTLAQNLDALEYTWTNLPAGFRYLPYVQYFNSVTSQQILYYCTYYSVSLTCTVYTVTSQVFPVSPVEVSSSTYVLS